MALPVPNLDDRRFQQFVDDAKRYIQERCPEWTDHNVSDPGVTLIETVAYMADQLVYRLNRVPDKNYLAFLNLLGVTRFPPGAARVPLTFWLSAPLDQTVTVPAGAEVAASAAMDEEPVVFSTLADLLIVSCELKALLVRPDGEQAANRTTQIAEYEDVSCFAERPSPGDTLLFGLSVPAPSCAVALRMDSRVDGVGVDPRQPPLVWEAWTPDGWQECDVHRDTTGGLNRPGEVVLHVPPRHVASRLARIEAGWLRCRVVEARKGQPFYSVSPTVRTVTAVTVGGTSLASHATTVTGEPLGDSSGVPGQRLRLAKTPVIADPEMLLLESSDGEGWQQWSLVDSFAMSGPDDRHVRLDPASGEISFGPAVRQPDGTVRQYGAVPLKGTVLRARKYQIGGGWAGNVARGTLTMLRTSIPYITRVENLEAARGGVNGETVDEAKVRAPITLRAQERAVTQRDYEELARQAAPETARIRCLSVDEAKHGPGAVRVLVVPQATIDRGGRLRFEQLVPGDELLARITGFLDERRPIGVRLAVGPPYYQGITAVVTLHAFRGADVETVQAAALQALFAYLDPITGGPHDTGWPFGRPVHSGDLFAVLQRVPGVAAVDEVRLYPADPITGKRADATERIDLEEEALVFSFDHRVTVVPS
ncbi:MAG TPA: putative baseplate assembly protein [Trebonia sp.]|jgi:predicted phage baseplate assembly protein